VQVDLPRAAARAGTAPGSHSGVRRRADSLGARMRVWVDLTNSPHVLVLRPIVETLRAQGHDVTITARDFAQTLGLLERFAIDHTVVGRHRGGRLAAKGMGLVSRSSALARWARGRGFDLAVGHGSNDVTVAARLLRIPCATMFDYEWAAIQHAVNCRLAQTVVVPQAIPPQRLAPYGATRRKIAAYPGLKEEYYLADFVPDAAVLGVLGLDPARPIAVIRTPPAVSLYHRFENDVLGRVLERLRGSQTVVLPRTPKQREELRGRGFVVPEQAIDAQSLIAHADLVVSAGGTMNREAVALGTPVWTMFQGRLGAVDERLIAEGRLKVLARPDDVQLTKRPPRARDAERVRRDPALLAGLLLRPVAAAPR
jgi:predicted glycosyltransferase